MVAEPKENEGVLAVADPNARLDVAVFPAVVLKFVTIVVDFVDEVKLNPVVNGLAGFVVTLDAGVVFLTVPALKSDVPKIDVPIEVISALEKTVGFVIEFEKTVGDFGSCVGTADELINGNDLGVMLLPTAKIE